jgi:ABC-type nickel/cobalt efflux system permease component RcnA
MSDRHPSLTAAPPERPHRLIRDRLRVRLLGAIGAALAMAALLPAVALAHPLGNFTINHYAGIRIEADRIVLDVVIDQAEIPTFQERQRIDADGDGVVSDAEIERERQTACETLAASLSLSVGDRTIPLVPVAAGLTFPAGSAGLQTMRLACVFLGQLSAPIASGTQIAFADTSHAERIGWREITAQGSGVTLQAGAPPFDSVSRRLTVYPTSMLTQPLDVRTASFRAAPGGGLLGPFVDPDTTPLPGAPDLHEGAAAGPPAAAVTSNGSAAVPGGVGGDISGLLETRDVSPLILLGSILAAAALGAGHALTPGHGKTLMGAYLVGTRGTPIHAIGLGLSVTVSHTIGIVVLAGIVIAFRGVMPPEMFNRVAPIASGILVLGIGGWLLVTQLRARRTARRQASGSAQVHGHGADHEYAHDHSHVHDARGHAPHDTERHEHGHDHAAAEATHSHGGLPHSHAPVAGSRLTWRSLFVLGLAGGIIPSTNALIILLSTIATGRAAYGLVLVIAFGLGMAVVLGGVGLTLVLARDRLERLPSRTILRPMAGYLPLVAGLVVFGLGIVLTTQAVAPGVSL